jgi:hypothetical protein
MHDAVAVGLGWNAVDQLIDDQIRFDVTAARAGGSRAEQRSSNECDESPTMKVAHGFSPFITAFLR